LPRTMNWCSNILLTLLSSLAKVEAQKISERTEAGMARAKAKGIKIGRPRLGVHLRQKIAQRAARGETANKTITASNPHSIGSETALPPSTCLAWTYYRNRKQMGPATC
jgi:DNA invertase Pin-like site-specific DNA recombinase